jgi:hypothetical protein
MSANNGFVAMIAREVKGPRGGRFLILGGILIMVFGCAGLVISNRLAETASPGSIVGAITGILLALSFLTISTGLIMLVIGSVIHLLQNVKANIK